MTPIQFRMDDETLAYIDALTKALKIPSRAAVMRLAILRMARDEFGTLPGDRTKPNIPKKGKR